MQLILSENELSVPRRVLVDLSRFKTIKRIQRGVDPHSIRLCSGTFSLVSLGTLTESCDVKKALMPVGYR